MCNTVQSQAGATACEACDYRQKSFLELSKEEICELMSPYEYELIDGGARIKAVKSGRDLSLRGAVGIPHFVTEISAYAFAGCKFLRRIDLPSGLRYIGEGAFCNCRDLFDVFIPSSVSYVGKGAFADCYDLSVICCGPKSALEMWDSEWLYGSDARVEYSIGEFE